MIYKHIAFDLDGTLINSIPSIVETFKRTVDFYYGSHTETDAEITAKIGFPLVYFFEKYPQEDVPKLINKFSEINDELQKDGVPFFDGIKDVLQTLINNGHKLYIVSSKRKPALMRWVNIMGVESMFEVVLGKDDTEKHKPHPEPLQKCMQMGNFGPNEVLYVGDSAQDIMCAQNAGVKVAAVDWTAMNKEELKKLNPDFWLFKPEDLLRLV